MPNQLRQRILLAEDDEAQREILAELLEFEGYDVRTAGTLEEVLRQLLDDPDAILLDVWGVSSKRVVEAVRRMEHPPACVLVSGDSALPELAEALGVDGYVPKPYDVDALLRGLDDALRTRRSGQTADASASPPAGG